MAVYGGPDIVTDGLVLHLDAANSKSYPGSGNTWFDLSGNDYNASFISSVEHSYLINKGSLVLDGISDSIILGDILNIGTGAFTLEFVAKKTSGGDIFSRIAAKGTYLSNNWTLYFGTHWNGTTNIGMNWGNPWSSFGFIEAQLDVWYHGVYTRDDQNVMKAYINNNLVDTSIINFNFNTTQTYRLASSSNGVENFKGNLSIWRQYNKGLSAEDVDKNYNALKGRFGL